MKITIFSMALITLMTMMVSDTASASDLESLGVTFCQGAKVACSSGQNANTTDVCIFAVTAGTNTAVVIAPDANGNAQLIQFQNVVLAPIQPGIYGAGLNFTGPDFSLHIDTDGYAIDQIPSQFTSSVLRSGEVTLGCILK
jgi:hypothetical protein